jgi:hypothetical protein
MAFRFLDMAMLLWTEKKQKTPSPRWGSEGAILLEFNSPIRELVGQL